LGREAEMPASMAGSRGGTVGRVPGEPSKDFIATLLAGDVTAEDLRRKFAASPHPKIVTLVINNTCNLRCAHCYLQVERLTAPALGEEEWRRLIDSVPEVKPALVCLSGKEVFAAAAGSRLLSYLSGGARGRGGYRLGVITNGTLVHRHKAAIECAAPSYFDISLDGVGDEHDDVRGDGVFARVLPNVEWAARTFSDRFFVNLTLQKRNWRRYVGAIDFLRGRGVKNVSCGFYRPLPYTSRDLALDDAEVAAVFEAVSEIGRLDAAGDFNVFFDLDVTNLQPLKAFLRSSWFSLDRLEDDDDGEHFIEHDFENGTRVRFRFSPYPTGGWRSLRITAEGNYLAAEDTLDTTHYAERAIGNVRDFGYDLAALHRHALDSPRFDELLESFCSDTLPELVAAFGRRPQRFAAVGNAAGAAAGVHSGFGEELR
jgi:MoaA/NifB/PqqE/SkfB family radical SAM enzyme